MFGKNYCIYDLWWWICPTNNPADILIRPFGNGITLVATGKCFELIWKRNVEDTERLFNGTLKGCSTPSTFACNSIATLKDRQGEAGSPLNWRPCLASEILTN